MTSRRVLIVCLIAFLTALSTVPSARVRTRDDATTTASTFGATGLVAGDRHTCVQLFGGMACWGWNAYGQLGDGTATNRLTPVAVPGLASDLGAPGYLHSCSVSGGALSCWGSNGAGELGAGSGSDRSVPAVVPGLTSGVASVATGWYRTCAVTSAGTVMCWGYGPTNAANPSNSCCAFRPVDITGLSGVASISVGGHHNCALTTSNALKCWGANNSGGIGDGTTTERVTPVDVIGLTRPVTAVDTGDWHTCALTDIGGVKCWGYNGLGQAGDGTGIDRTTPVDVLGLTSGVTSLSVAGNQACAVTAGGGVKCWGRNHFGQLGDGTKTNRLAPVEVVGLTRGALTVAVGDEHACALEANGRVQCWGSNAYGQLGDGTTTDHLTPADVIGLGNPQMNLDRPAHGATAGQPLLVEGWAVDLGAQTGTGVNDVHVYAFPIGQGTMGAPIFLGHNYFASRPDVGAILGSRYTNSGFSVSAGALSAGQYRIGAYVWSAALGKFIASQFADITVTAPTSNPAMYLDDPATATVTSPFIVGGWAVDRGAVSGSGVDTIHVWAFPTNGAAPVFVGVPETGRPRSDIAAAFGTQFLNAGFRLQSASLAPGAYRLVAYARSTVSGTFNDQASVDVVVAAATPPTLEEVANAMGQSIGQVAVAALRQGSVSPSAGARWTAPCPAGGSVRINLPAGLPYDGQADLSDVEMIWTDCAFAAGGTALRTARAPASARTVYSASAHFVLTGVWSTILGNTAFEVSTPAPPPIGNFGPLNVIGIVSGEGYYFGQVGAIAVSPGPILPGPNPVPVPPPLPSGCTASVSPNTYHVGSAAATIQTTVSIARNCAWISRSQSSFITVSGNGPGPASLSIQVEANPSTSQRVGSLLAGKTAVTIVQDGTTPPPTIDPTPLTGRWSGTATFIGDRPCTTFTEHWSADFIATGSTIQVTWTDELAGVIDDVVAFRSGYTFTLTIEGTQFQGRFSDDFQSLSGTLTSLDACPDGMATGTWSGTRQNGLSVTAHVIQHRSHGPARVPATDQLRSGVVQRPREHEPAPVPPAVEPRGQRGGGVQSDVAPSPARRHPERRRPLGRRGRAR